MHAQQFHTQTLLVRQRNRNSTRRKTTAKVKKAESRRAAQVLSCPRLRHPILFLISAAFGVENDVAADEIVLEQRKTQAKAEKKTNMVTGSVTSKESFKNILRIHFLSVSPPSKMALSLTLVGGKP